MTEPSGDACLQDEVQTRRSGVSRRNFLRFAGVSGAAIAVPGLAACGKADSGGSGAASTGAAAGKKTGTVVAQVPTLADEFFKSWLEGYRDAAKALGMDTKEQFPNFDQARETSQAQQVKTIGGLGLLSLTSNTEQEVALGKICEKNGVKFISAFDVPPWFTPEDVGDNFVNLLTPSTQPAATEVAKTLFESMGGEGELIHLQGRVSLTDTWRTLGLDDALKEYPNIKLVRRIQTDWTREAGRKTTLNVLSAFPNVKGIFAQSDTIGLGVLSVLKERKMTDVKVVGMDGIPEVLPDFDGPNFVATSANVGYWMAGFSLVNIYDALNGWKPETPERILSSGSFLTTKDSVHTLRELYAAKDKHNAFDFKKMSRTLNPDDWDPQFPVYAGDMFKIFKDFKKDRPVNPVWKADGIDAEIKKIDDLYASHYKSGPLKKA
jgi:ribose transport system substrate-binding protein